MCGTGLVAPLFAHGAAGCDLAVVEGVMGLYDGAAGESSRRRRRWLKVLKAPVVLVVDASSQSRSVAALVHGFASWDPQVRIGGVILNKVATDSARAPAAGGAGGVGVPVLGVLRRSPLGGDAVAAPGAGPGGGAARGRGGRGAGAGGAGAGGLRPGGAARAGAQRSRAGRGALVGRGRRAGAAVGGARPVVAVAARADVHVLVRGARRAAHRRRGGGGGVRPAAGRGAAAGHAGAGDRRQGSPRCTRPS